MSCDYCGCCCEDDYGTATEVPQVHTHPVGGGKSHISVEQAIKMAGLGWQVVTVQLDSLSPEDLLGLPFRED
jgi:hypothetical protein